MLASSLTIDLRGSKDRFSPYCKLEKVTKVDIHQFYLEFKVF